MMTVAARRQLVTCEAAQELFALDIAQVERVLRFSPPRAVPNAAAWLRGVIAHGNQLVPVLDLRERLSLGAPDDESRSRIVVVALDDGPLGVIVDVVHEIVTVDSGAIEPPPAVYRGLSREFVEGLVRREERIFVLLNVAHLVSSKERLQMRELVNAGGGHG